MSAALTIAETAVRKDAEGRFCLNDLHRAAGGEAKHTPGRFTITQQFKELAAELSRNQDSPEPSASAAGIGTFVAKELVYAYAMWISAAFHLKVIRAYDAMVSKPAGLNAANPTSIELLQLAMQAKTKGRLIMDAKGPHAAGWGKAHLLRLSSEPAS